LGLDASPDYIRRACDASLRALGVEAIGLYQYHRPDPAVPYAEASARSRSCATRQGAARRHLERQRRADRHRPAGARCRRLGERAERVLAQVPLERGRARVCTEAGIAFLPWSPLGGVGSAGALGERHAAFAEIAGERGVSPQRVCVAWILAKSPVTIPIPGASRPESIEDSAAATHLELSADETARLDAAR
jgi:aryl-alcohol dehydrogenase-like predicted oxidoreductase